MHDDVRASKKPTLLLTGSGGFIGSYLKKALGDSYRIMEVSRVNGYDITNLASLKTIKEPIDIIIHAAAEANGDYESLFQTNVEGTLNICKLAQEKNVSHLVLLSTIFALDHPENGYFNTYGKTKKLAEDVALAYCAEKGIDLSILRLTQIYDDAGKAREAQAMLYFFIDTIRSKGEVALFGTTNPLRNYLHVDDLCQIVSEVIGDHATGIYNVLHPLSHTINEIAYMIFDNAGKKPSIARLADKADIQTVYLPSMDRYQMKNGAHITLKEGIERILEYDK